MINFFKKNSIILLFLMIAAPLLAKDAVIVAAGPKLDVYDAETMSFLGKFSDMKKDGKFILTPSSLVQTKDGDLIVVGSASNKFENKYVTMVKIGADGKIKELMVKQETRNAPINSPKRVLELSNGDFIVLENNGKINRFSSTGEQKGEFFKDLKDGEKANDDKIEDIALYDGTVVVTSYQPAKKIMNYNEDGTFITASLSNGNDAIKSPSAIYQMNNKKYLLVDTGYKPNKVTLLDSDFTYEKDVIIEGIMTPIFAIKNEKSGEYVVIDNGRTRKSSYDDNLEIFNTSGEYQSSKATYKDGVLRTMIYFKGLTKE